VRYRLILGLSLAGLGVSAYLWSAKAGAAQLMCGPVGDCATVNSSPYSEVLGVPVAAWGACLYAFIALCSGARIFAPGWRAPSFAGFAAAVAGALFSLYLTALEAFVIHAYCAWCIVSWVIVTSIAALWGTTLWREGKRSSGRSDHPVHE